MKKKPAAEKKTKPSAAPEPDSSVAVNCAHIRMEKTDSLKPHPRNPNSHPEDQIKLLANIIAKTGWRSPIVVSKRSGFVVKGHGRLMAAKLLGLKSVPVDFQEYDNDEAELADMVADNRVGELAEWDRPILKDILQDLDTGAFDMLLTGFDTSAVEALMTEIHLPEPGELARPHFETPPDEQGGGVSGCDKDEKYFYVEFYGDAETFSKLATMLATNMSSKNRIDPAFFKKMVEGHFGQ